MASNNLHPRHSEPRLVETLDDTPVVLIHGPRQCGKTTLARGVGDRLGYTYLNFDADVTLGAATADPVDLPERTILDEVQRAPGIFTALKTAVDRDRRRVSARAAPEFGSPSDRMVPGLHRAPRATGCPGSGPDPIAGGAPAPAGTGCGADRVPGKHQ